MTPRRAAALALAAAFTVGAALRLDQFPRLVLIDDEWHAVHRVLFWTPARMFVDFNIADYGIQLGLAYWALAHGVGLSEMLMRAPMLACGLALLAVLPWAVLRPLGAPVAVVFALLLATSPMLVLYSQMARPYAITLLLTLVAHEAFQRYWRGSNAAAIVVVVGTTLATWLHPVVGPFAVAPFAWGLWDLRRAPERWRRWLALAAATALALAALLLPPLLARPAALGEKSGFALPSADTLAGVVHWWLGTSSGLVAVLLVALAALGAPRLLRALPAARTVLLGLALTLAVLLVARPQYLEHVPTLGRYLLPAIPLLLLAVAAGSVDVFARLARRAPVPLRHWAGALALLPVVAQAATSPLQQWLHVPNSHRLATHAHFDFRPRSAPFQHELIPLSPFWATLAAQPRGSLLVAAAPFYFESFHWDAQRWERQSGQRVIPGFLSGLCARERFGEVPDVRAFRFANAVHLGNADALRRAGVDYVVWQKPYAVLPADAPVPDFAATAACEPLLRARWPVAWEDAALVAFRLPRD